MGININQDIDTYISRMTREGMKAFVKELLMASDAKEKKLLRQLQGKPTKNDLADLDEEMHGRPNTPKVEENDDPFELEAKGGEDEEDDTDAAPKKKGRK